MNNEISGKTLLSVTASIAAAIIPDTPIVSIAGATLSEITTTTTSTTTTPTPTPTPTSFIPSTRANKDHSIANLPNNPMSDAAATKSAGGNGTTTANAAATNITTISNVSADAGGIAGKSATLEHASIVNVANAGKTDDATTNTTIDTKKSDVSDLEEPDLKKLLEEAYTYKTPKDKKDKSEIFLDLLQKVENEDLGITSTRSDSHRHHPHSQSRHQQKQGGSLQDLLQLPSDYRRQNHTSRHKKNSSVSSRQREGGSLPSNVNVANCLLSSFEQQASVYADKRVRRAFLLGVETATVALNNNNTLVGVVGGNNVVGGPSTNSSGSGSTNSTSLCSKESGNSVGASVTSVSGGSGSMATTASAHSVGGTMATGAGIVNTTVKSANSISSSGDYIINIGDMMDIQQQQQILPSKAQDGGQGLPFYERVDIDMRIPRPNLHRGEGGEFAPTRAHHYVDEVIRFHQIDGGEDGMCESGEVAISVNALGNTLKSAAASCSLPMPLDERYRSIKSVMGEKGDGAASLNASLATKTSGAIAPNSISSNNNTNNSMGSGNGSSSIGIGSYTKSMPLARQMDENGNDCERQQHSSSSSIIVNAGQSQAKAKAKKKPQKDNTIPVDVENEAGYRGKDPVEVLVKFIESTEEDNKQGGSGGNNNKFAENSKRKERKKEKVKQNKMKKSNSLEELRSCAKIDVGELKQSAATTESNNVTMRSKGTGSGKGAKNNSASTADINKNFDGSSKEVTGKQAAVVVVTTTTTPTATTANNRKGERRSWGTEELQYLGTEGSVSGTCSISGSIANSIEEKAKDRKEKKGKEKEKDKERDIDREKDKGRDKEKDKEKTKDSVEHDKLTNSKVDGNTKLERHDKTEKVEKTDKSEKPDKAEKSEKTEKLEKRKKSESIMQSSTTPTKTTTLTATNSERQNNQTANTPVFSAIDLLSMNTLISETAEFHVVTKKRKPKKQRASIDETHFTQGANYNNSTSHNNYNYNNNNNTSNNSGTPIGFSRAHNLVINSQKFGSNNNNNSSTFGSQQQQQYRYKYYNNNTHGLNTYGNGGSNNSNSDGGRLDYHNNYNSNYNNNYANSNNSNHSHQQCGYQQQNQYHHHHHQQQNQHQQQQQQQNNVSGGSTDKSRRKSTSSVPPSEKSDSSDLDSVHSLPIESTAASASKSKQRHKPTSSTTTTPETPKSSTSGGSPASAPISYAHIAAAAAVDRWPNLDAANNNNIVTNGSGSLGVTNSVSEQPQQHLTNAEVIPASQSNANNVSSAATAVTSSATSSAAKPSKSKKLTSKPDFPELVSTNAMNATIVDINKATTTPQTGSVTTGTPKTISYSQSLVAVPAQLNTAVNVVSTASGEKTAGTAVEAVNLAPSVLASNTVPDVSKVDTISGSTTRLSHQPMQHQQQQQTLQKSKSVEHDSYSFNSSNLDQQYPALEKTVKRHSATNVSISPPTAAGSTNAIALAATAAPPTNVPSTAKFNFAAAAKQQAIKGGGIGSQPITTTSLNTTEPPVSALAAQTPQVAATATSSTNYSMTTPVPTPAVSSTNAAIAGAAISVASSGVPTTRKVKEKSPTAVYMPTTTNPSVVAQPTTSNISPNISDAGAINTVRKSKKEKAHQMLASEVAMGLVATIEPHGHVAQKSSTATQTQSTSMDVVVMASKPTRSPVFVAGGETGVPSHTLGKTQRHHMSNSSGSNKNNAATGVTATSQNATTATAGGSISISSASNRPAVIILNDDRSGDSSIEFTFGDFNEDELKFFDESIAEGADEFAAGYNDEPTQKQSHPQEVTSEVKVTPKTVCATTSTASFIDSDIASNMLIGAKSATAKQSFGDLENSNQISVITAITTKESGNKLKVRAASESGASNNSAQNSGVNSSNVGKSSAAQAADSEQTEPLEQQQLLQRRSSETTQLQQLETCNDIETAILAAARAAAEQQHQQPMQPPPPPSQQQQRSYRHKHQHQQQQYRSTSYGNAYDPPPHREHRSQSAYARDTPNHYQPQQHHYHNQYHQQSQQQQHYHYHQSGSSNSASRSRSSSSNNNNNSYDALGSTPPPQSPNPSPSVVVNIQRKEFDIHFIPPTMSNAYSALQHNDIIVDFIGSAWEEVAKVAKFYEGQ